jgi:hypothetical protein
MRRTHKDKLSTMGNPAYNIPPKYPYPYTTETVWDKSGNWTIMQVLTHSRSLT